MQTENGYSVNWSIFKTLTFRQCYYTFTRSLDCRTVRFFAYPSTREQSNKRVSSEAKRNRFWEKKTTVLQSNSYSSFRLTNLFSLIMKAVINAKILELTSAINSVLVPGFSIQTCGIMVVRLLVMRKPRSPKKFSSYLVIVSSSLAPCPVWSWKK